MTIYNVNVLAVYIVNVVTIYNMNVGCVHRECGDIVNIYTT